MRLADRRGRGRHGRADSSAAIGRYTATVGSTLAYGRGLLVLFTSFAAWLHAPILGVGQQCSEAPKLRLSRLKV